MYSVDVTVRGTAPLLQHRFPMPDLTNASKGGRKVTGAVDYSDEWRKALYVTKEGEIYQPAIHFEAALTAAAARFKVTGGRGRSYKDLFKAAIFVAPDEVLFGLQAPDELDTDADKPLYIDARPAVVQRARIVRLRPAFKAGWELSFEIECLDDQIHADLLQDVLILAGRNVGIGDHRPRFGRFSVSRFEVHK